jgi:hypothetical protein
LWCSTCMYYRWLRLKFEKKEQKYILNINDDKLFTWLLRLTAVTSFKFDIFIDNVLYRWKNLKTKLKLFLIFVEKKTLLTMLSIYQFQSQICYICYFYFYFFQKTLLIEKRMVIWIEYLFLNLLSLNTVEKIFT